MSDPLQALLLLRMAQRGAPIRYVQSIRGETIQWMTTPLRICSRSRIVKGLVLAVNSNRHVQRPSRSLLRASPGELLADGRSCMIESQSLIHDSLFIVGIREIGLLPGRDEHRIFAHNVLVMVGGGPVIRIERLAQPNRRHIITTLTRDNDACLNTVNSPICCRDG